MDKQKGKEKDSKEYMKPFNRQSYHVAIAYHIHLKKVNEGLTSGNQIDPTYNSRQLRGGKSIRDFV